MAVANRAVVKEEIITVVDKHVVEMQLSIEEAQFLVFIMARIGGDPTTSRRRHANAIDSALNKLVPAPHWSDKSDVDYEGHGTGVIYFKDESKSAETCGDNL